MLKILKRIVQEVTTANDLTSALTTLVKRVREAVDVEAASAFLFDDKHEEYVLIATDGLNKQAESSVRVPKNTGLIGLVGRREEPINIENVFDHPKYHQEIKLGEERMNSFLGVPIIQHRKLCGVLVLQRFESRCFDGPDEAFLVTLASQLGGMIAHAEATGELSQLTRRTTRGVKKYKASSFSLSGMGCVPGVAIGNAVVVFPRADINAVPRQNTKNVQEEIRFFYGGLSAARETLKRLGERLKKSIAKEEQALFDVYLHILAEDSLGAEVEQVIRREKLTAQAALAVVVKRHIQQFEGMKDDYLRERADDFRDLGQRVLTELQASQPEEVEYPEKTILVGDEITATTLAEVPEGHLLGIVSAKGSKNSHVAILARALGVPSVMGVRGLQLERLSERLLIVDGYNGHVFVTPSKTLLSEYQQLSQEEDELNETLVSLRDKPAETIDHYRVSLQVNTGLAADSSLSLSVGAEGVGLYRSEIPFMSRDRFPSENEQHIIYRQTLNAFSPRVVTMRTLDIGGDKTLPYFPIQEENPYLGWRGIRITLDHPDLFLLQVRAMMRANEGLNNLRIMLPMITALSEVDDAIVLIDQAYNELLEEGHEIKRPPLGVMIEVPAIAYQAHELAKRVSFLSVGTNDLTQYLLAVDRNNARVANLYDHLHPAMLRALVNILSGGHGAGVEVSVCGEMASDPHAVILLMAMGFDTLSMNSASLPRVKWVIRKFSIAQARKLLAESMAFEHPQQIREHLQKALVEAGVGGLIRAGKT